MEQARSDTVTESMGDAFQQSLDHFAMQLVQTQELDEATIRAIVIFARAYNRKGGPDWYDQIFTLPMCLHLRRETLKKFLLDFAKQEDVESAKDSILGKWAMIAKKAKELIQDPHAQLLPHLVKICLI